MGEGVNVVSASRLSNPYGNHIHKMRFFDNLIKYPIALASRTKTAMTEELPDKRFALFVGIPDEPIDPFSDLFTNPTIRDVGQHLGS